MLFVVAAPWTPILAWIHDNVELRIDTFKLCFAHQRPWPRKAQDIGTWQDIFTFVIGLSVVLNAAIMIFVLDATRSHGISDDDDFSRKVATIPGDILSQYDIHIGGNTTRTSPYNNAAKVWCFNLIQYGCFSIMMVIAIIIPDVPDEVEIQRLRQEYWVLRFIRLEEDEDDEDEVGMETSVYHENTVYESYGVLRDFEKNESGVTLDQLESFELAEGDGILVQQNDGSDCPFRQGIVERVDEEGTQYAIMLVAGEDHGAIVEGVPPTRLKFKKSLMIDTGDGDDQTTEGMKGIMGRVRPFKYDLDQEEYDRRVAKDAQIVASKAKHEAKLSEIYGS